MTGNASQQKRQEVRINAVCAGCQQISKDCDHRQGGRTKAAGSGVPAAVSLYPYVGLLYDERQIHGMSGGGSTASLFAPLGNILVTSR